MAVNKQLTANRVEPHLAEVRPASNGLDISQPCYPFYHRIGRRALRLIRPLALPFLARLQARVASGVDASFSSKLLYQVLSAQQAINAEQQAIKARMEMVADIAQILERKVDGLSLNVNTSQESSALTVEHSSKLLQVRGVSPRDEVVASLQAATPGFYFSGDFGSWAEASAAAGQGWAAPDILEKVRASALKAKRGEAAFERDSIAFPSREVRWPLLTCICMAALHSHVGQFHLLDFGGSLGSTYFQHRAELSEIPSLAWSIVEQPNFVDCGQREFQDDVLQFFETIGNAARRAPVDLAMFSGSLQYVPDPFRVLESAADTGAPYLILDRLPIIDRDRDMITLQHVVDPRFHPARLPHRAFSKRRLFEAIAALGYRVLWEFPQFDGGDERWIFQGALCKHQ